MAGQASDYHRGEQDIHEQVATFRLIMNITKWGCVVLAALLVMLVLWFCTPAGFMSGLFSAAVILTLGILVLRSPGDAAH